MQARPSAPPKPPPARGNTRIEKRLGLIKAPTLLLWGE